MGRHRTSRTTIGVRELKSGLSSYLRRVRNGETIDITDRGQVVAELAPRRALSEPEIEARIAELERQGHVRPPRSRDRTFLRELRGAPGLTWESVKRELDRSREDKF